MSMDIAFLAKHLHTIPILSDWYRAEWEPYYGRHGPGDARRDLESRCNDDKLPLGLIALTDGEVVGTVALDLDPSTNLTPSAVGLVVRHDQRKKGVATALLQSAEEVARQLAFDRLYMSTTILGNHLTRLGWQQGAQVTFMNNEVGSVFVKVL